MAWPKKHCYLLFWCASTQPHLKQIVEMETSHPKLWEYILFNSYNSIYVARIYHKILFQSMENQINTEKHCFLLFWWTSYQVHLKQGAETETPHLDCWKTVSLTFMKASMLPGLICKFTFQFMENQGNPMKTTVFFWFDELPLKLAKNRLQK